MVDIEMITIGGIRYRPEDAARLGLQRPAPAVVSTPVAEPEEPAEPEEKAAERPANKARHAAANK